VINSFVGSFKLVISSKYPNCNHDKDILVDNSPLKFYQGMKMFMAFQHHRIQRLPIISITTPCSLSTNENGIRKLLNPRFKIKESMLWDLFSSYYFLKNEMKKSNISQNSL
jgi:hypothetical protein